MLIFVRPMYYLPLIKTRNFLLKPGIGKWKTALNPKNFMTILRDNGFQILLLY